MLHSIVSYFTSFMLFGESGGAASDGGTMRVAGNGARRAGGRRTGRTARQCPMVEARWGRGASAGWAERPRNGADRADCECEVSPPDTREL